MFFQVLLVDAQHVGRGDDEDLHMIMEGETVEFAKITGFADTQITDFKKPLKRPRTA